MADNLLSRFSWGQPMRNYLSQGSDDEAMANYLAMQPPQPVRNGLDRDALLPWAYEVKDGQRSPTGQFAVPQLGVDVWDAIKSVGNAPLTAPYNPAERDSMIEHAGAVVGPMAGVGIARGAMLPRGAQELGSAGGKLDQPGIRAFHGSPHDFDRFSLDKIGTGEGAQAYGHGLYFAENEGVAKSYRDDLSKDFRIDAGNFQPKTDAEQFLLNILKTNDGDLDAAIATTSRYLEQFPNRASSKRYQDALEVAKQIKEQQRYEKVPGKMYEVSIKANPEDFLDWDKPVSQQPDKVKQAVNNLFTPTLEKGDGVWRVKVGDNPVETTRTQWGAQRAAGRISPEIPDTVSDLRAHFKSQDDLTKRLREAGIPGFKYLDQGSRAAGDGSRNYVVFDDALVEILRKYGLLPPAVAGGALAASSGQDASASPLPPAPTSYLAR